MQMPVRMKISSSRAETRKTPPVQVCAECLKSVVVSACACVDVSTGAVECVCVSVGGTHVHM